ncbi:lysine-arginine-ornithine-binding periplasmic protein [compost metagenome]
MLTYLCHRLLKPWWLGALLSATTFSTPGETLVTLLVDENYPPYAYRAADGTATGIYPDILRAAEARLHGYRLKLKPTRWRRALAEVEAGRALAVVPPSYRPRERPFIGRYSTPLLEERVAVFCRQSVLAKRPHQRWPEDFQGLRFGVNLGSLSAGTEFWQAKSRKLITVEEAPGTNSNLLKMLRGRIDCFAFDRISTLSVLAGLKRSGDYDQTRDEPIAEGPILNKDTAHVGYTNRDQGRFPFKEEFATQLDTALDAMRRSGEIEQIVQRYTD